MKDNRAVGAPQDRWGTPDPRNENDYPAPDSTRPAQWAWELLRRRSDFRKAWTEIIEPLCDPRTGEIDGARVNEAMNIVRYLDRRTGYLKTDQALPVYVKSLSADGSGIQVNNPLLEIAARFVRCRSIQSLLQSAPHSTSDLRFSRPRELRAPRQCILSRFGNFLLSVSVLPT